ncbi:hypothetical protein R6Q57_002551, partial [Mikania cordata]
LNDLVDVSKLGSGSKKWKKMVHAVCVTTLWCIWRHRNKIVFKSQSSSNNNLLEEIRTLSFLWVKKRAKLGSYHVINGVILMFQIWLCNGGVLDLCNSW